MAVGADRLAVQAAVRPQGFDLAKAMSAPSFFLARSLEDFVSAAATG